MWGPKILLMPIPTGGVGGRLLGDFSAATQACLRQHTKQLLHFLLLRARSQVASNPRFAGVLHVNCYTSGKKCNSIDIGLQPVPEGKKSGGPPWVKSQVGTSPGQCPLYPQ